MSGSRRITKRVVDAASPRATRYELWDADLPGFGLRIEPSGTKAFILRYRANGGGRTAPRRFIALGRAGVLTADEARGLAKSKLADVARGGDPAKERRVQRDEMTIEKLLELYSERGSGHLKERTRRLTIQRLRNHVVPLLGSKRLSDVNVSTVERFLEDVSGGKTAKDVILGPRKRVIVRGGAGAAAKVVRDLSAVFSFGIRLGLLAANPCRAARKPIDGKRYRYLSLDEIARLGSTLDEMETGGYNQKAIRITRLLLLTGCRRSEIVALKWADVRLDEHRLVLSESKTGRSYRPLSRAAIEILSAIPNGSEFVFPSERGRGHFQGLSKFWSHLQKLSGLHDCTPHTLRHTLGSIAASTGNTLYMVGALLGHANERSTAIYAHMQMKPMQDSANVLGDLIGSALLGKHRP